MHNFLKRAPRFYLSEEGKIVAEGALKLYPELKELVYS
jgi:hypothetical protein